MLQDELVSSIQLDAGFAIDALCAQFNAEPAFGLRPITA